MHEDFLPPGLTPEEENLRLRAIVAALMDRSERGQSPSRPAGQLQHVVALEQQVRTRTRDLAETLDKLRIANSRLSQAERMAVRARNSLTDALEAMREGFALFDAQDSLTMWNSRFCAGLPDLRRRIGRGLGFRDYVRLVSESPFLHLPDGQSRADWVTRRLESHRRKNVNFIVPLRDDQWIQVSEQRMPSGGTAVTQTDVTAMVRSERDEREKLLDEQAQMVRATLDHIDQGVAMFDAKARLAGYNRTLRDMFLPPVELLSIGTPFASILDDLTRRRQLGPGRVGQILTDWVQGPSARPPLALEIRQDDGTILQLSAQAMPDSGFVMSLTDLTKERRAIAELHRLNETLEARVRARTLELESARDLAERANTSKSRFVASASHDLLQPLNAAKLFLGSLSSTALNPGQARLTERIRSAFGSVEQILGALLDISKFDIGAARARPEPIALGPLLDRLQEEFTPVAQTRGLQLIVMPSRAVVHSDAVYLKRILQNLISNAIRYTLRGKVLVGARRQGRHVRLEVWDTGTGIPQDKQSEIFQEFTRLAPDAESGMGLGLAIVEQASALLGHPLELRSIVGKGTVFTLTVPLSDMAVAALCEPAGPDTARNPLDDLLVLVIENDPTVRAAMMEVLEHWGASPLEAACLAQADQQVAELGVAPDIILADFQLDDGENGIDVVAQMRGRYGQIPAILITANHMPELARRAESAGMMLMTKPVPMRRLKRVLQQVRHLSQSADADDGSPPQKGDHSYWLRLLRR
ncbi:PAS-domain containing protein [Roseinatronobacter alkalisoli]|uniref:histidine kinase n=1 Tax=Roseinatronobacter alkalisoli TaxID=3028235 RepID=A0ABT5T6H2_9RHOB|nr:PAS-domain containing protein [Roseinatronobacter sp. HJB301]MDD7970006.1 PAS-domain containing protein [Roseinatronobacter sp. HJB301]